jgi:hypothetical protein
MNWEKKERDIFFSNKLFSPFDNMKFNLYYSHHCLKQVGGATGVDQ